MAEIVSSVQRVTDVVVNEISVAASEQSDGWRRQRRGRRRSSSRRSRTPRWSSSRPPRQPAREQAQRLTAVVAGFRLA